MPSFGPAWLGDCLSELLPPDATGLVVALSGGADSTALLAALAALRDERKLHLPLRALHVDHGLQAASTAFRAQCRQLCLALQVPLTLRRVTVASGAGQSVEAAAREARLAAFVDTVKPGECLLSAQHADDQLETFLLQAFRGAGVAGLAAMPERSALGAGWMLRPLLPLSGASLRDWLRERGIGWIEDPSNADLRFDRNYLRQIVLPAVQDRWPAASRTVARSARHAALADEVLREQGRKDAQAAAVGSDLEIAVLRRWLPRRQSLALRAWLLARGLPVPDEDRLAQVLRLFDAREDAQPCVSWPGAEVRRHAGLLLAQGPKDRKGVATPLDWRWARRRRLALPGGGSLELREDPHGELDLARLPALLTVGTRQDVGRRTPVCDLKSLLRESGVPAWRREAVPLLFESARLLAVADLWCDPSLKAVVGSARRGRFVWRRP